VNFSPLTTLDGAATSFVDANGLRPALRIPMNCRLQIWPGPRPGPPPRRALDEDIFAVDDADIGSPTLAGSAYESIGTVDVKGTGSGIASTSDQFHYVYVPFTGNLTIKAQVVTQGDTNGAAEAGVMLRNSLAANSACVMMALTPTGGATFQSRSAAGSTMTTNSTTGNNTYVAPDWLNWYATVLPSRAMYRPTGLVGPGGTAVT